MKHYTENVLSRIVDRFVGTRGDTVIDALAKSQPFQSILEEIDQADVQKRTALCDQLAALPAKHESRCAQASSELSKCTERRRAAEQSLKDAFEAEASAYRTNTALGGAYERERTDIERALLESSDPRIGTFLKDCEKQLQIARHCDPDLVHVVNWEGRPRMVADNTRANVVFRAIADAMAEARALRMLPLSRSEVTLRLRTLAQGLAHSFTALSGKQLTVPVIEGDDETSFTDH